MVSRNNASAQVLFVHRMKGSIVWRPFVHRMKSSYRVAAAICLVFGVVGIGGLTFGAWVMTTYELWGDAWILSSWVACLVGTLGLLTASWVLHRKSAAAPPPSRAPISGRGTR